MTHGTVELWGVNSICPLVHPLLVVLVAAVGAALGVGRILAACRWGVSQTAPSSGLLCTST